MKIIKGLSRIVVFVLLSALLLCELGTVAPQIPVVGSMGNFITMPYAHIVIPITAGLFLLCTILCFVKKKKVFVALCDILLLASLAIGICTTAIAVRDVNKQGSDVNVWKTFSKEDVSGVETDTQTYFTSEYGELTLNVYYKKVLFKDGAKGLPVILYTHGGGWIQGSKKDHEYDSKLYAENNYVAVSVDYDLSKKDRHLAGTTERQILEAIAWVKKNIAGYGGDPESLYLTGDSAGGNLALNVSYKINAGIYTEAGGVTLPKIKAVAVTYPVTDPVLFYNNKDVIVGKASNQMATYYTGGSPEEKKEAYDSITPKNFLSSSTPPTLVITGKADVQVPLSATEAFVNALQQNGTETNLVTVPFCNHAFDSVPGAFGDQVVLHQTLRWFEAHR